MKMVYVVRSVVWFGVVLCLAVGMAAGPADAAPKAKAPSGKVSGKTKPDAKKESAKTEGRPSDKSLPKKDVEGSTICIEAQSGLVISEHNADVPRPPASMVKMMMLLLVAEGLRDGAWTLDTPITVSAHAQRMGGTQVFLKEGDRFTLNQLMQTVAVHSANDAAMAVAEGLWGSEDAYKKRVNERAAELGMVNSAFHSVHGLPPDKGEEPDLTTARDMARVGQFCVLEPVILGWVSQKEFQLRPENAVEYNTNKLLWKMPGCDGIKTGYTRMAGFCITATAVRDGVRLIAAVMGVDGKRDRFELAQELLEEGFAKVARKRVVAKGENVGGPVPVANCETAKVQLKAGDDLYVVVKQEDADKIEIAPQTPASIRAPIAAGTVIGEARVRIGAKVLGTVPLVTPSDLAEAGLRWRLMQSVKPQRAAAAPKTQ